MFFLIHRQEWTETMILECSLRLTETEIESYSYMGDSVQFV